MCARHNGQGLNTIAGGSSTWSEASRPGDRHALSAPERRVDRQEHLTPRRSSPGTGEDGGGGQWHAGHERDDVARCASSRAPQRRGSAARHRRQMPLPLATQQPDGALHFAPPSPTTVQAGSSSPIAAKRFAESDFDADGVNKAPAWPTFRRLSPRAAVRRREHRSRCALMLAAPPAAAQPNLNPSDATPIPSDTERSANPIRIRSEGVDVETGARFRHSGATTTTRTSERAPAEQHQVSDERQPPDDRALRRLVGGRLLAESPTIVAFMRERYGRGPIKAKTYVLDNLIVCVLTDEFTAIERTMMQGGEPEHVLECAATSTDDERALQRDDRGAHRPHRGGGLGPVRWTRRCRGLTR